MAGLRALNCAQFCSCPMPPVTPAPLPPSITQIVDNSTNIALSVSITVFSLLIILLLALMILVRYIYFIFLILSV
jgi:hypothetical protein